MLRPEKMTVDDFVKQKVLPECRDIVAELRRLMRECAPNAKEVLSYGVPMYRQRRALAVISPTKKGITFALSRGAEFEDEYGLLEGVRQSVQACATTSARLLSWTTDRLVNRPPSPADGEDGVGRDPGGAAQEVPRPIDRSLSLGEVGIVVSRRHTLCLGLPLPEPVCRRRETDHDR